MLLCAGVQVRDLDGKKDMIKQWILENMNDNYTDEGSNDEDESRDSGNAAFGQHVNVVALLGVDQQPEEGVPVPKTRAFPSLQVEKAQCEHCHEIHGAHNKQCEVANRLLTKMQEKIQKGLEFDDFEVFILVPNLNSLYNQTVTRLQEFRKDIQSKKNSKDSDSQHKDNGSFLQGTGRVLKANLNGKANKQSIEVMKKRIEEEKTTLFLLIHDEAHYEATRHDTKDTAVNEIINSETVLKSTNVLTLLVSATPYNLVSSNSRIPEANIVDWMNDAKEQDAAEYFGLAKYVHRSLEREKWTSGYIADDPEFENRVREKLAAEKKAHPEFEKRV
jgi:hypothetical protein